jgi:hypothetical protein
MGIKNGQHTRRDHRLDQGRLLNNVHVCVTWWRRDLENGTFDAPSIITITSGCANMHIDISPAEARALAASLTLQADEVENARYQIAVEAVPA